MNTETTEKLGGRAVRQYSVFLANRVGALMEVVQMLNEERVVVLGLSIQDSSETSIARIIVSDPDKLEDLFGSNDIPYGVCELVVAELEEGASDLPRMLAALLEAEVNIFFSYTPTTWNAPALSSVVVGSAFCAKPICPVEPGVGLERALRRGRHALGQRGSASRPV